jgi:hypothetical protein
MRRVILVALVLVVPSVVHGQPVEQPPPPATGDVPPDTLEPVPPPPPVAEPTPQPPPQADPPPADVAPPAEEEDALERPEGFTVGIGLGFDLPNDLTVPNTTSVRFRLRSGLTLEPFVVFNVSGTSFDFEDGDSTSDSASEVGLGTNLRIPAVSRGPVDFIVLGGARFDFTNSNPDGSDNDSSSLTSALVWGLGLEYWLGRHGVVSFTATNPLVSYTSSTEEQFDGEVTQSSWSAGAIFRPEIILMAHMFL